MNRAVRAFLMFLAGAVIGTLGDQIHVQLHVLWYAHPMFLGQAFWVPLLFGMSVFPLVYGHWPFSGMVREDGPLKHRRVVAPFLWFAAAYLSTGLFAGRPVALALGLTSVWCFRLVARPGPDKLFFGLLTAAGGTLFEAGLSSTGAFHYFHPDVIGVPVWLPAFYLHVSLFARQISLGFLIKPSPVHSQIG